MYKKISFTLLVFGLMTAVLTACSIEEEAGPGGPQVHMAGYNFIQDSIIINKGDILTLVNDVAAVFTLVFDVPTPPLKVTEAPYPSDSKVLPYC